MRCMDDKLSKHSNGLTALESIGKHACLVQKMSYLSNQEVGVGEGKEGYNNIRQALKDSGVPNFGY